MPYPYLIAAAVEPDLRAIGDDCEFLSLQPMPVGTSAGADAGDGSDGDEIALMTARAFAFPLVAIAESSLDAVEIARRYVLDAGFAPLSIAAIAARYDLRDPRHPDGGPCALGSVEKLDRLVVLQDSSEGSFADAGLTIRDACAPDED